MNNNFVRLRPNTPKRASEVGGKDEPREAFAKRGKAPANFTNLDISELRSGNEFIQQNKDAYDAIADPFSSTRDYVWNDLKPLEKYITDGDTVLDIGCGNGRLYQLCEKKQDVAYIGLDQSAELITHAEEKFSMGSFVVSDMQELPLDDASIDTIFCIAAFHHIPPGEQQRQVLKEMHRVLKPGGQLVMVNWNLFNDWVTERVENGKYATGADRSHVIIPWMNAKKDTLAQRHYWAVLPGPFGELLRKHGFGVLEQYYSKQGEQSDALAGDNLISIATRKA